MILAVNTGSSSVRLAWFDGATPLGHQRFEGRPPPEETLRSLELHPDLVVHRVVHGGTELTEATVIDDRVEAIIERLVPLAPLHQPVGLRWIRAARAVFPAARMVAVLDTGFFAALPEEARHYGLPPSLGVRRYGFHGLAHAAMWRGLSRERGRAITLQLGSGASAAAILDGRPIDTSMGMTPLEGLVMATRPGDLDPGVVLELAKRGLDVEELLNQHAGLLGLSGESGSPRALLASSSDNARLALAVYVRRIKKYIGAYLALLGGADALVFSGGVGEHQPEIRQAVLEGLQPFGLVVDGKKNLAAVGKSLRIDAGAVEIHVLVGDEEQQMVDAAMPLATR